MLGTAILYAGIDFSMITIDSFITGTGNLLLYPIEELF
jgi:hypothetical protein